MSLSENHINVSLVIPCYNGSETVANNLPDFLDYLKKKNYNFEVIIVDDGSTSPEETQKVAEQLNCRYIGLEKHGGKGAAVKAGMLAAKEDFRVFTDADIPFEYENFDLFVQHLSEKEFDIVVGDRTLPDSKYYTEISRLRKFGSNIFSFIVGRFVVGGHFADTQCGMKGFRKEVAEDIFSYCRIPSFAFDVEVLYMGLKRNYTIKKLPVQLRRQEGSSVRVFLHGLGMVVDLFKIKRNQWRGRYVKKESKPS
ncbi:MAG: glycosyltransferase [Crocinitomicaceae bacterium]|nr:glycosyltransferase [Crocinitomicaceae bacterium]